MLWQPVGRSAQRKAMLSYTTSQRRMLSSNDAQWECALVHGLNRWSCSALIFPLSTSRIKRMIGEVRDESRSCSHERVSIWERMSSIGARRAAGGAK